MKKIQTERGQSLVEMAVSLVLLLLLLSGAVEFGMAFFQFIQLRDAAQEGAFYGSIDPPQTAALNDPSRLNIIARTQGASNTPINLSTITPTITIIGSACESTGNAIKVELTYDHKIFMPFMSAALGGRTSIPLTASVTDTILSPACP